MGQGGGYIGPVKDQVQKAAAQEKKGHGGDYCHGKLLDPCPSLQQDQAHYKGGDDGTDGSRDAEDLGTGVRNGVALGSTADEKGRDT